MIALLLYFGGRLVFFAGSVSPFVPPDEVTHFGKCVVFSQTFFFPDNSPATYRYGLVTNTPWLYYWIMGRLLHFNILGISDLVFLRLCNIPLAFGTVWYAWRMLGLLTDDRLTRLLLVAAMTNTMMFSFLSASVSNDNLTNLLAAMSIYYLFAFMKYRNGNLLLISLLSQLAGSITKNTALLLSLLLAAILFAHEFRAIPAIPASCRAWLKTAGRRGWVLLPCLLLGAGLALQLHGGNYLRYGTLDVTPAQVLTRDDAMQYRIGAREEIFRQFRDGLVSYTDALLMTSKINHVGDRSDTVYMLMTYENLKLGQIPWLSFGEYAREWLDAVWKSVYGVKGHRQLAPGHGHRYFIGALLCLAVLGFALRWRPRREGWLPLGFALLALGYGGYIFYKVNYQAYLYYGTPGITLQGRYLFPVLAPLYVFVCYYLLRLFSNCYLRGALALVAAMLFIWSDFPVFLSHVTPEWFRQ